MEANFWHQRWENQQIGFHLGDANPLLVKYANRLSLGKGARVFLPLCGKTLDIAWLLSNGFRVAGAELSAIAIDQLFESLGVEPTITAVGALKHYSAHDIDIFVGDIFELTLEMLGPIDAIYDRAALVALPFEMRVRYAAHLQMITQHASQLLIQFVYDQNLVEGPPFSISDEEIQRHYKDRYALTLLESAEIEGGLKGKYPATENVWLLQRKA